MSTRWYPLYQRGNPQLRVFLPNFWMKLVRPVHPQPPNVVQFQCSMEMTKFDVKNYIEKIYGIKTVDIKTRIALGKTRQQPGRGYIIKADDIKYAYAILPKDQKFEFPNLFPEEKKDIEKKDRESLEDAKSGFKKFLHKNKERMGVPGWYSF